MSSAAPGAERPRTDPGRVRELDVTGVGPADWAYIALGSNLGDSAAHLREAAKELARLAPVMARSSIYATTPVGGPAGQNEYLNAVIAIAAPVDEPARLLARLLGIEAAMGRERRERWGPRVIDLDLLAVADVISDLGSETSASTAPPVPALMLPHPRLAERAFVLVPLCELASQRNVGGAPWRHPVTGLGACAMLARLHGAADVDAAGPSAAVRRTDLSW